jgi:lysophospholipase L1-like esterase
LLFFATTMIAATPPCSPLPVPDGLAHFYAALDAFRAGRRPQGVSVLHLGDSHIALDHMTGVLRGRWHDMFGDGGRGMPAGVPYRYYAPQGYEITMSAEWRVASSLRADAVGAFGMSGFRVEAANASAHMSLQSDHAIGEVEIEAYGGPHSGSLMLQLDDAAPLRLSTRRATPGVVFLRVPAAQVHRVKLSPVGNGTLALLGWAMLSGQTDPGLRYDSYGISGATLDVVSHWDGAIVDAEIRRLVPDLIMLGYGTNEGFGDRINADAYGRRFEALIARLERLAPDASIVALGAFDGMRRAKAHDDQSCEAGWATPPKLGILREMQRDIALRRGHVFIDGELVMGGPCSMARWVNTTSPLAWPDHVHLRPEGARRAGAALWQGIMRAYETRLCRTPH